MANLKTVAKAVEQRAAHKLARGTVDLPLPVYGGKAYAARFGVHDPERMSEAEQAVAKADELTAEERFEFNAEFLADACRCILGRPEPGAKWERLEHDDGRPVRFDEAFAEALDLEPPPGKTELSSMADVVLACWTVEDDQDGRTINAAALNTFSNQVLTWMQDTSRTVEGELVGELNGASPRAQRA